MSDIITKQKHQILQYNGQDNNQNDLYTQLNPETQADAVTVDNSSGHYGGNATNVQSALEELFGKNDYGYIELSSTSGTLDDAQYAECLKDLAIIKVNSGSQPQIYYKVYFSLNNNTISQITFRQIPNFYSGADSNIKTYDDNYINVNSDKTYTKSNNSLKVYIKDKIDTLLSGKQDAFSDGTDIGIASESNGIVKIKAGLTQSGGTVNNSSDSDITLGASAKKGVATSIGSTSTDDELATAKAVYTAISSLSKPMVFKGTLGTGGTITSLATASASNEGYAYKVITAGTYASTSAKVGDVFVCAKPQSSYSWVLIPSGDDIEDTWRNIKVNGTEQLGSGTSSGAVNFKNGTGINASYNSGVIYSLANNYGDTKNPYASKTKNYVLASPSTEDGVPTFRALVSSDIPDLSGTYQPKDADLTAIAGLSGTSGLLKKTANNTWALDTSNYKTENDTITLTVNSGVKPGVNNTVVDIEGTDSDKQTLEVELGDSGVSSNWADGVNFRAYSVVQVNKKGIVTGGNQLIEVGTDGQTTPSADLAIGGIFFKKIS